MRLRCSCGAPRGTGTATDLTRDRGRQRGAAALAKRPRRADMAGMRSIVPVLVALTCAVAVHSASAQSLGLSPTPPSMIMPPPPSPPPPKIEVPVVPKMNAPLSPPKANLQSRGSFSDRVAPCLDQGAALGLGPNERAEYSRGCANR